MDKNPLNEVMAMSSEAKSVELTAKMIPTTESFRETGALSGMEKNSWDERPHGFPSPTSGGSLIGGYD
jgi:hypothetical protein